MVTSEAYETATVSFDFISRLGFRAMARPKQFYCVRNGEPLELSIHFFENKNTQKVIYYTEAKYIPTGHLRHVSAFQFKANEAHEKLHKFCLYDLFFDEKIESKFEEENTFHPSPLMNNAKAASWLDWMRVYWNTNHFKSTYKALGGLNCTSQIIHD